MATPPAILVRVPGKLMLAGEYAVLAGGPALACAVSRHLTCEVRPAARCSVEGNGLRWEEGGEDVPLLCFTRDALRATRDYLAGHGVALAPAAFSLRDELKAPDGTKLGLGGSACSTVAVVGAALAWAGRPLDKPLVFKLAAVAHAAAQKRQGSAVDVAAATYGGTLFTWRFEAQPLVAAWRIGPAAFAAAIDRVEAPPVERLPDPAALLLAFSGTSASTASLVGEIERYAIRDAAGWADFVARTSNACDRLRRGLEAPDAAAVSAAVGLAARQLEALGQRSGTPIVTEAHRAIAREAEALGVAAKVSGAGGGDSCVALGDEAALARLESRLREQGTFAVRLEIDPAGVARVEGD